MQQDELEALQITFYEIESWIEKTTPVLGRMTRELDKASEQFDRRPNTANTTSTQQNATETLFPALPISLADTLTNAHINDQPLMPWILSFQPGNSLRLDTNITSVDQLVDAVQKIALLTGTPPSNFSSANGTGEDAEMLSANNNSNITNAPLQIELATEFWAAALSRHPNSCLEKYEDRDINIDAFTQNVPSSIVDYMCRVYWECLHPKFADDMASFYYRSTDPRRNQVCIDSQMAMVLIHVVRHDKDVCKDAYEVAYFYYERARQAIVDSFDTPDTSTLETLMNLAMFCVLCKRQSQARIYISLAYRMLFDMEIHPTSGRLPTDPRLRRTHLRLFMVFFYTDMTSATYSGEPDQIKSFDTIDFYELIQLTELLTQRGQIQIDTKARCKETYAVHFLELAKIGKKIQNLAAQYHQYQGHQQKDYHSNSSGKLPPAWANRVRTLEISLATWFSRLPAHYRQSSTYTPTNTSGYVKGQEMDVSALDQHARLLLQLGYQNQWLLLHKIFLSPKTGQEQFSDTSFTQCVERSHKICTDAANRIVGLSELISEKFGWCVCQQFINCIYQASTVFCRNSLGPDEYHRFPAQVMLKRILSILTSRQVNYNGLPNDIATCLNEFLSEHGMATTNNEPHTPQEEVQEFDTTTTTITTTTTTAESYFMGVDFDDSLFNSPLMYQTCKDQQTQTQAQSFMTSSSSEVT
ncbi:hypothetical protein J3Q64DRAFT_1630321 [Phycomyces blakesleeanus]|uniref:Xylanolytic transcriptional activator regulatory domain-containing protein n=1 Tax=Phycomyces blakesleeanus TaxID=4837 RepID=A0ABR3BD33_PHYBL